MFRHGPPHKLPGLVGSILVGGNVNRNYYTASAQRGGDNIILAGIPSLHFIGTGELVPDLHGIVALVQNLMNLLWREINFFRANDCLNVSHLAASS